MAKVSGGRGDGNRSTGEEPKKKRTVAQPIKLSREEEALARKLCALIQTLWFALALDDMNRSKNPEMATGEDSATRMFTLMGRERKAAYFARNRDLETLRTFPGIEITLDTQGDRTRVTLDPKILLNYLESESGEVALLIEKIRAYEKELPSAASMGGDHMLTNKLAGLCANTRTTLTVYIPKMLKELDKEITLAARVGNKEHEGITHHAPGGKTD